jgi:hypothetical protein
MRAQLDHLTELAHRPELTLQVIPFAAGAHTAMASEFSIFSFEEDPDVVCVEAVTGTLYLDRNSDINRATLCFDHLRPTAHTAVDSVKLIVELARRYG